MMLVEKRSSV